MTLQDTRSLLVPLEKEKVGVLEAMREAGFDAAWSQVWTSVFVQASMISALYQALVKTSDRKMVRKIQKAIRVDMRSYASQMKAVADHDRKRKTPGGRTDMFSAKRRRRG